MKGLQPEALILFLLGQVLLSLLSSSSTLGFFAHYFNYVSGKFITGHTFYCLSKNHSTAVNGTRIWRQSKTLLPLNVVFQQ